MLYFILSLFNVFTLQIASAQAVPVQRAIELPAITAERSVQVQLDAHAKMRPQEEYTIRENDAVNVPLKVVHTRKNIAVEAAVVEAPVPANTVNQTTVSSMFDGNATTYFQPEVNNTYKFLLQFNEPVAPDFLALTLQSGYVRSVGVKIGTNANALRSVYTGNSYTRVTLPGEQITLIELTLVADSSIVKIAEFEVAIQSSSVVFIAQPTASYTLVYGVTDSSIVPNTDESVFIDATTVTAKLGPIVYAESLGEDSDSDGIADAYDVCPSIADPLQLDKDSDGIGDACDNAPAVPNALQKDTDKDGIGDNEDNCPFYPNPDQKDVNLRGIGWACEDTDNDGVINAEDNCVGISNRNQADLNNDGIGDVCADDLDKDGIPRTVDNCSTKANKDQSDGDNDGIGDACDVCPKHFDPKQLDRNANGIGDVCEQIFTTAVVDTDADTVPDTKDNCKEVPNVDQADADADGVGDMCDNCVSLQNANQRDSNNNGTGDVCTDSDQDGILDPYDNCRTYANADQKDNDEDGIGNPCDDDDNDRIENAADNCQFDYNPRQLDADKDGVGNACDTTDSRWSESNTWIAGISYAVVIIVLVALGALILKKTAK